MPKTHLTAAQAIERRFSLSAYLLSHQYQQVTPRVFVRNDSPEIIRVSRHNGRTYYRNFLVPGDQGTAIDFLCHRSHTDGVIVPNRDTTCLQKAIIKAALFTGKGLITLKKGLGKTPASPGSAKRSRTITR